MSYKGEGPFLEEISFWEKLHMKMTDVTRKRRFNAGAKGVVLVLILILTGLVWERMGVLADDTELYQETSVEPNVMILFDTSGSMLTILPVSGYAPDIDYSTPLLSQGKQIVFAREANYCYPTHHRVTKQGDDILLKYIKATSSTEICSGSSWQSQYSEEDGYFYFDRASGIFLGDDDYDSGNPDHIRIFLPYATYSVDVNSTGDYVTRYDYNYMNWLFYHSTQADRDELKSMQDDPVKRDELTRVLVAKKTIHDLIDENLAVRFGISMFDGSTGGRVKADIPSNNNALHSSINELWVGGSTPLAEALEDMWDYFGDQNSFNVDYWCRPNFVIIMTDGLPQNDADDLSGYIKKDWDGDSGGTEANGWMGNEENLYAGEGSGYLDDVAYYMARNDARPDVQGDQDVMTYTIGFTIRDSLLEDTARNGGGSYHAANDAEELSAAFHQIIQEILEISNSYTAPVVPISQMEKTTSGSRIYLALFKPSRDAFWKGNIKKFGIATQDDYANGIERGDILDKNGTGATDDSGYIYETSISYWGTEQDGGETEAGGVGQLLLDRTSERNIYSILCGDYAHHRPFTHAHNAFAINNNRITPELLGVADDTERDKLIDFVHGFDAYDEDADSDTAEKRDWILGAFLHSRPEIVHYDSTTTVIYAGANDGMLHAFDDATGEELWAFIPPDLLGKLKNLRGNSLEYFVDGSPRAYIIDNDHDSTVEPGDGDQVILAFGERRGGYHFYALDVTVPTSPDVLWNVNPGLSGFSEMGQTWSTPVFGQIRYGNKLVVFLSGGYDSNQDNDPVTLDDTMGRGVYMVELLTGDLIWKYTYANDSNMQWSIPSDVAALDTTDNGFIDRVYVGDMGGRLWRFGIGDPDPANWTNRILFNANAPVDGGRKIFYQPDVSIEEDHEMVFFGTGDRAHPKDEIVVNRIYAVKDKNKAGTLDEYDLIDVTDNLLQDPNTSAAEKTTIQNDLTNGNGWYIRLIDNLGEKVLAPSIVFAGIGYFTTYTPPVADEDPCHPFSEGIARLYALGYRTGGAGLNYDTANDPDGGQLLDRTDRSLVIGASIPSALVLAFINGEPLGYVGVRGGILNPEIGTSGGITRIYWRQFF
jgi:type IV pilus assembly protein PilY1